MLIAHAAKELIIPDSGDGNSTDPQIRTEEPAKELIIPDSGDGNSMVSNIRICIRKKELIIPDSGDGNSSATAAMAAAAVGRN